MRLSLIVATLIGLGLASPALALGGDTDTVYFWEDENTYGWSEVVDSRSFRRSPIKTKKGQSITETCARLVGRTLRQEGSDRSTSLRLEDSCIRNGGKL